MTRMQEDYLRKLREAIIRSAGEDELDHILELMKRDMTENQYREIIRIVNNERS